jgi:glucosamine 6-phosphate synthetase-like amidotransferase/phosphosugar isomerase protein
MMCGISGVSGPNAARISLQLLLGQLERGVQGTGVAYLEDSRIHIVKSPINPIQFVGRYFVMLNSRAKSSIAHNRMPSKGNISYYNTHPFLSCDRQFAIVHNGTTYFKRHTVLKLKKDHRILGDTDSELICHLLEEFYRRHADMVTALSELADSEFSGSILVLLKDGQLFALRKGLEPVHFAVTSGNVLVASTEKAIRSVVDGKAEIRRLKSGQILRVRGLDVRVHDTDYVSDFDFEDYWYTVDACDWRSYFRTAKTLKYFF